MRAVLRAGADKVAVNTAAIADPGLIRRCARVFGRQCVVVAVDVRAVSADGGWEVLARGGRDATGLDAVAWVRRAAGLGAGEILLTSIDRAGPRAGRPPPPPPRVGLPARPPRDRRGQGPPGGRGRAGAARGGGRLMAAARVVPRWGADGLVPGIGPGGRRGRGGGGAWA